MGLLAEPFPPGFAFSDTATRVFILMASRRLTSDRFFTTDYTPEVYTQAGLDWVADNDMRSVLLRHFPQLEPALEGVKNPFAPWTRMSAPAAADGAAARYPPRRRSHGITDSSRGRAASAARSPSSTKRRPSRKFRSLPDGSRPNSGAIAIVGTCGNSERTVACMISIARRIVVVTGGSRPARLHGLAFDASLRGPAEVDCHDDAGALTPRRHPWVPG